MRPWTWVKGPLRRRKDAKKPIRFQTPLVGSLGRRIRGRDFGVVEHSSSTPKRRGSAGRPQGANLRRPYRRASLGDQQTSEPIQETLRLGVLARS